MQALIDGHSSHARSLNDIGDALSVHASAFMRAGGVTRVAERMGTTNGIDVRPNGRTAYVTEVEHQRLVQFRVDRPGVAWQRWQKPNRRIR